jgi:hypothetical protein
VATICGLQLFIAQFIAKLKERSLKLVVSDLVEIFIVAI